jgi:hypothetical protein
MTDVAGGVPATGAGPVVDLLAADPGPQIKSATSEFLDRELSTPREPHRTIEEVWIETPGQLRPGYWKRVES